MAGFISMDNRKIDLIKNTTILTIGNFSSKFFAIILVPVYTHYLQPSDYGKVDIYLTILSMFYVLFSLQSIEAVFRFIQDCKNDQEKTTTISNALATALFGIMVFAFGLLIVEYISNFKYCIIFMLHVATNILANFFFQSIRGMNKMTIYATLGILSTIIQAISNIVFIVGLGMGAISLLWAPTISNTIVVLIAFFVTKIHRYFRISAIKISIIKEQLKFSLPLIPNSIFVWMISSLGRFILLYHYSVSEVGILAIVLKFPQLLGMLNSIFYMAWQVSLISQFDAQDKDKFASEVFNQFSKLQLSAILIILPFSKIIIFKLIGESYISAWIYIPIFFMGIIFNSYAQFYNSGFYGAKKTSTIFFSSLISFCVYFVVGMMLAKPLYIFGIGIAYSVSGLTRWLIIKRRVAPYMKIRIDIKQQKFILALLCVFIGTYYVNELWIQIAMSIIGLIVTIYLNRVFIHKILKVYKLFVVRQKIN